MPSFQTTRQKNRLLLPTKQPLTTPKTSSSSSKTLNPSSRPAALSFRSTTTTKTNNDNTENNDNNDNDNDNHMTSPTKRNEYEYDLARIPQPFLDPSLWANMKAVERLRRASPSSTAAAATVDFETREREEVERRRRERDAEFGGMAVRGRRNVR